MGPTVNMQPDIDRSNNQGHISRSLSEEQYFLRPNKRTTQVIYSARKPWKNHFKDDIKVNCRKDCSRKKMWQLNINFNKLAETSRKKQKSYKNGLNHYQGKKFVKICTSLWVQTSLNKLKALKIVTDSRNINSKLIDNVVRVKTKKISLKV